MSNTLSAPEKRNYPSGYPYFNFGNFLWHRISNLSSADEYALNHYSKIACAVEGTLDQTTVSGYILDLRIWIGMILDTPDMADDARKGILSDYPEFFRIDEPTGPTAIDQATTEITLSTDDEKLKYPYHETAFYLWHLLNSIPHSDTESLNNYVNIIRTLTELFDKHLTPGYLSDLYAWAELKSTTHEESRDFGNNLREKYADIFTLPLPLIIHDSDSTQGGDILKGFDSYDGKGKGTQRGKYSGYGS